MKVLVTGGAGYIGSVTAERLLEAGHEVTVFDNLERGHRPAVHPGARFVQGDLRDAESISSALAQARPEAVMHFAAYALVGESMVKPEMYFRNNVGGGLHLCEAARRHDVRQIVFSSTCATYGLPDRIPITEDAPQVPVNPYGESKLMLEKILSWYGHGHGLRAVFLRYFNACGATRRFGEDHDPETHLIPNVLDTALGRHPAVSIYGDDYDTPDGTCRRDYVHIEDLAEAHIRALRHKSSAAFNLGTGRAHSVREVIQAAREVTGAAIPVRVEPRRPGDPATLVASAEKARKLLGWEPKTTDLRDIIRSAWEWRRTHPRGYAAGP